MHQRFLFSRFFLVMTLTFTAFLVSAQEIAKPLLKANISPQTKTVDGVAITLLNARWIPRAEMEPYQLNFSKARTPAFFAIDFRVETPQLGKTMRDKRRAMSALVVEAITPDGQRLRATPLRSSQDDVQTRVWRDFRGIDPRLKDVNLEFTWVDPAAPEDAAGAFREKVEWSGVPLPSQVDQPLTLNLTQTTAKGIRVRIESSVLRARYNKPDDISFYVIGRWLPPIDAPDVCAELRLDHGSGGVRRPAWEYDTGLPVEDRTHHVGVSTGKSIGRYDNSAGYFTAYAPAPPAGAKSMTLRLELTAHAASLQQSQWLKPFRFTIPLDDIPLPATAHATQEAPIAESMLGDAHLLLEALRFHPDRGYKYMWLGEVLLRTPQPRNDDRQWVTTALRWYQGNRRDGTVTGMVGSAPWRLNGTPLQPNEAAWLVTPSLPNDHPPGDAPRLTIESDWKEVQYSRFTLNFPKLPVPRPGHVITPDAGFSVGELGQFVVRKIGYFDETHTLSTRVASRYVMFQPPYGLAVVLQYMPATGVAVPVWSQFKDARTWNFSRLTAHDASGRDLRRVCDEPDGRNGPTTDELAASAPPIDTLYSNFNEADATKNGYFLTLYLLPPKDGMTTFNLQLDAIHETILRKQTIVWPHIVLPQPIVP